MVSVLVAVKDPACQVIELHERLSVTVMEALVAMITSSANPGITPPTHVPAAFQLPPPATDVMVADWTIIGRKKQKKMI